MKRRLLNYLEAKKIIILILAFSLILNIIGLYPNTLLHPNEPGLVGVADQLFKNIVFKGNPDPNLEPHPFKYGSFLFYTQAFVRGTFLTVTYFFIDTLGVKFGFPESLLAHSNFQDFVENNGPYLFRVQVLWVSRFVNSLYGTGCVFLVYLICQKIFNNKYISYLSAIALAIMPHHVRDSHYATADIPLSFFILLSFFFTVRLFQKKSLRNFLLAGFFAGFASALKYYPLALVPLLLVLMSFGLRILLTRIFIVMFSAIIGYIVAMPYIFVHYDKIFAFVPYVLWWQAPDQLVAERSLLSRFLPTYYHQYPLRFLITQGILPIPFLAGILGIILGIIKYRFKFVIIASVPIVHFLFVNFYVKQIYEYILIPMLPFFAIFIGTALSIMLSILKKRVKRSLVFYPLSLLLIIVIFLSPLIYNVKVGLACAEDITDFQNRDWILKNIPENSYVAYHPGTRHPDKNINWIPSNILEDYSLSEILDKGGQYMIQIDGYTSVYTYWADDYFIPPKNLFNNQYAQLVKKELETEGQLIAEFKKPYLCAGNTISLYKLPEVLEPVSKKLINYSMDTVQEFNKFKLLSYQEETSLTFVSNSGYIKNGAIWYITPHKFYNNFRNTFFYYSTPMFSEAVAALPGSTYTATAWIKPESSITKSKKDGFIRLDFYKSKDSDPILTLISPKAKTETVWQELKVTGIAPSEAKFLSIGFGSLAIEDNQSFLIDDLTIYTN